MISHNGQKPKMPMETRLGRKAGTYKGPWKEHSGSSAPAAGMSQGTGNTVEEPILQPWLWDPGDQ